MAEPLDVHAQWAEEPDDADDRGDAAIEGDAADELVVEGELVPAVQRLGVVISDDASPSFGELRFRLEPGEVVAPGQFVTVVAAGGGALAHVLCRVLDVHEVNPHEDPLSSTVQAVLPFGTHYAPEGESTIIYRIARAEPIEQVDITPDGVPSVPHEVSTLALSSSPVISSPPEMVTDVLGFCRDPDDGLHVGNLHSDPSVPAVLVPSAVQRHVFIAGGIGSGKSYTRGVLAEELRCLGVPQVNIDINGEMIDAAAELGGLTLRPGADGFTMPLSSLTREDVLEAIAGVQRGTNIETLIGYSFDVLQTAVLRGRRRDFSVEQLVAEIEAQAPNLEMKANTSRPAALRTRALHRLAYIGAPFDWRAALVPGAVVNIDVRGFTLADLRIVTAAVARDLQNLARRREIPFTVLSIDEFHLVAPGDDRLVSTQVLREIARVGRHYRLGLILTTQSPSDVDRSVLKRLLTRFLHTIEPDQLDALRGVFADAPAEVTAALPKMPQGTCLVTGVAETVRHAAVIDVRRRVTTHGGATPDVFADLARRGWPGKRPLPDPRPGPDESKGQ